MKKTFVGILLAVIFVGAIIFVGEDLFKESKKEEISVDKNLRKYRRRTPRLSDFKRPAIVEKAKMVKVKKAEEPKDDLTEIAFNEGALADDPSRTQNLDTPPSIEELEQMDDYFDQLENSWDTSTRELLVGEIGLPEKTFEEYVKLRESYYEEKMDAFDEFQEEISTGRMSYREASEKVASQMNSKYEEKLRGIIGDDNMYRFNELRNEFNQELLETYGEKHRGVMSIDF